MNKNKVWGLLLTMGIVSALADNTLSTTMTIEKSRPSDFVNVKEAIPPIQLDIRYYSDHNFVGRRIVGYTEPVCLLTRATVEALKTVENKLLSKGLTLKIYDCYRPQMAVNDFAKWANEKNSTKMQQEFYPAINKSKLFEEGYIAYQSGHTRGSTVDLTIVPVGSSIPTYDPKAVLVSCTKPKQKRFPDNSLDFGTGYDCFSPMAHPGYKNVSFEVKKNRQLLQTLMEQAGFRPLATEWWHFTLINEPYPNTYFDFPV